MTDIWTKGLTLSTGKKVTETELREIDDILRADAGRSIYQYYLEDNETLEDIGDTSKGANIMGLPDELSEEAYRQIYDEYLDICGNEDNFIKGSSAEQDAIIRVIRELGEEVAA